MSMEAPDTQPKQKTEQEPLWIPEQEQYRQWMEVQTAKKRPAPKGCVAAIIILTIMAAFIIMLFMWKSRDIFVEELEESDNSTDTSIIGEFNSTFNESAARNGGTFL